MASSTTSATSTAKLLPFEDQQCITNKYLKMSTATREQRNVALKHDVKCLLEEMWGAEGEENFCKIFMRETLKGTYEVLHV